MAKKDSPQKATLREMTSVIPGTWFVRPPKDAPPLYN